ncbi:MAG: DUF5753 domain-containing protein, partial [Pseudonocardiaceae bacterium]
EQAEAASTETVTLRAARTRGLGRLQQDGREFEASATSILIFQPVLVPRLLQVPEYARRIFSAGKPSHSPAEIATAVAARMDRQLVLYEGKTHFEFVIAEAALRWRVGPPLLMLAQLDRITALAGLDNVEIAVVPLDSEVDAWHEHGFTLLADRPDDDPVVHVETQTSAVTTTDLNEVAFYRNAFARLREAALHGPEADALLRRVHDGLLRSLAEQ